MVGVLDRDEVVHMSDVDAFLDETEHHPIGRSTWADRVVCLCGVISVWDPAEGAWFGARDHVWEPMDSDTDDLPAEIPPDAPQAAPTALAPPDTSGRSPASPGPSGGATRPQDGHSHGAAQRAGRARFLSEHGIPLDAPRASRHKPSRSKEARAREFQRFKRSAKYRALHPRTKVPLGEDPPLTLRDEIGVNAAFAKFERAMDAATCGAARN